MRLYKNIFEIFTNNNRSKVMSLSTVFKRAFGILFLAAGVVLAQVPTITSFTPTSAAFNSSVTITGTNFNTTPANNIVMIGNLRATVTSASATSLTVTVPRGASVGKIAVTTGGRTAVSAHLFTTTFTSAGLSTTSFVDTSKLGYYGKSITVGDMDGDGLPDILSLSNSTGIISISRHTGAAGPLSFAMFATAVTLSSPTSFANDIAIGDLDSDGKLDIVVVSQTNDANPSTQYMSVFRNTSTPGTLSFETRVDFASGTYPNSVSIADADGDGKPDIVTTYSGVSAIYRNTHTSGSFSSGSFAARVTFGSLSSTKDAVLSDMNGDKKPELIVASSGGTMSAMKLTVYNNTSVTDTIKFDTGVDFLTLQSPRNISVGDFDFNGKPDIMLVAQYGVALFDNQISGTITTSSFVQTTLSTSSDLSEGAVADFDGDGKQDFIYGFSSNGSHFRIFRNIHSSGALATGSFSLVTQSFGYNGYPTSMAVADFDRDGRPDFVNNNSNLMVFRNKVNVAEFSPASYSVSLGTVPVGTIKTSTITVSNPGSTNLSVTSATSTNGEFTVSPSSVTINGGSNQQFTITFQSNSAGAKTSKLVFLHNGPAQSDTVSVNATNSFGAQGTAGQMIQFDGVDDYLNIPDATHPTAYTIEAWVKFNTISAQNVIVRTDASGPSATFTHQLVLNAAGKFAHYTFFGTSNNVVGTTTVVAGQWYHVAITAQNSGMMRLYVNGVEEGTAQSVSGTLWASGTRWMVGINSNSYEGSAGYFNGSMDELRIWNTARTASQIQSSYGSLAGNESNLSRYFRFDEGIGTTSGDGTGNGIIATLTNSATWGTSTTPLGTPVYSTSSSSVIMGYIANGATRTDSVTISNTSNAVLNVTPSSNNVKLTFSPSSLAIPNGQSAKFYFTFAPQSGSDTTGTLTLTHNGSGSPNTISVKHLTSASFSKAATAGNMLLFNADQYSDFASTAYSSVLNPSSSFTYEVWARNDLPEYTYGGYVVSSGDYYTGVKIYPDSYGWSVQIGTGSSPIYLYASGKTQSVWYHLAVTYSGTTVKFYVNGVLRDTKTGTYNRNTTYPFYVGTNTSNPWYSGFTGAIDEVRVWNTDRTQEQIFAEMTNSYYGNEPGLVGYWRFDEGSGTTVTDMTGGGRNLTLGGTNYTPTWQSSTATFPAPYFKTYTASLSYGNVQTAKTKADSFYVRNFGGTNLSVSSVTADNARYNISPTSATIASNDSAKFIVTFAPSAVQAENGTITLTHDAYGSPNTVTVSGTGATASYSSNVSSIPFGTLQVGVSKIDSVTITNSGTISLVIDSVRSSNSNYTISPTSATIAASGTQKFYITFAAATPTGAANGTISFYHSVTGSPGTVSVTGTKVQQAAANAGTALTFDGTNDYVSRAVFSTATNNVAFDAWVKWDGQSASGNRVIVYNGSTGTSGYGLIIEGSSTPNNALTILNGGVAFVRSTYVLTTNQWQHVAVVRESGTWKLYVDGVQQTLSNSSTTPNAPSGTFYVGSNVGGSEAFKGSIDEVRFWSTARTQTQIQASYNSLAGNESGLAAYYRFDENNGTTAYDNSGNGRNGTLTNGPTFASSTALIGTPTYSVAPSSKAFGSRQVGTATVDSFTVSNTGGGLLNIGTITSGNAAYTITPSNVAIRSSSSQKFYVTFLPPAPAAAHNTTLSVPHNASGSPNSVSVTGTGVFQAASNAGNGLTFDGSSKFVDIASHSSLSTSSFTVEFWIKIGATWGWSGVIDKGRNTGNNWFILTTNSGAAQAQGVTFGMQGGAELVNIWGDAGWHHVAATFDGSTQRLYVDGVLTGGFGGVTYTPTNDLIRIGGRQDTSVYSLNPFNGNIDEVRLWNVARSESEIRESYSSRAGNEIGLVSYLRFDEPSGTTAYDATGNGRIGSLMNGLTRMISSTAPIGTPTYSASGSSLAFGTVYLSVSKQDSITVTNTGSGVLNTKDIASDNAQFSVTPSTLTIASGASGKIYVTVTPTSLGSLNGNLTFTHNASGSPVSIPLSATSVVPAISSFSPLKGTLGSTVTISGSGFSTTPANNIVYFGSAKATVTSSTATSISVTVPPTSNSGKIRVTVSNLTTESSSEFITTFSTSNVLSASAFSAPQYVSLPSSATTKNVSSGDFDNDGKIDVVAFNVSSSNFSVFRNTTTGDTVTFAARVDVSVSQVDGTGIVADFDGDGKLDVALGGASSGFTIKVYKNTSTSPGSISFSSATSLSMGGLQGGINAVDLDGDGKLDIVSTQRTTNVLSVFRNTTSGSTISFGSRQDFSGAASSSPRMIAYGDFDADGKVDIVMNNRGTILKPISIFPNTSTVGTISLGTRIDYSGKSESEEVRVADLNSDGKLDIIAAGYHVDAFQNTSTSTGSFTFTYTSLFSTVSRKYSHLSDYTGDGKPDLLIPDWDAIRVLRNTSSSGGSLTFDSQTDVTPGNSIYGLTLADLNSDGKMDIVATNQSSSYYLMVYRNTTPLPAIFSPSPSSIAIGNSNIGVQKNGTLYVKNTGGVALSISAVSSTNAQFSVSPVSGTIAVGDSLLFTVTFTPSQVGATNASIAFTNNTSAGSDTISVSGTGVGPVLTLSASSKSYGNVLVSTNKKDSIYLKNTGNATLSITNVVSDNAEFTVNATTFSVNALDSAKLIMTFAPASSGTKSATIQITHNGQTSPTSAAVDGRGIQPIFSSSAANIAFGSVGYYQAKTDSLTVTNTGVDTLIISSVTKTNAVYTVTPTSANIAPSSNQKFYITYAPVALTATNDTLMFTHNAGSTTKIPLSGTGALLPATTAGNALDLNGSSQYADLADGVWFNGNFTVETWVYIRAVANYTRIIDFANGQSSNNIIITASEGTSGKIGLHIFSGASSTSIVSPNAVALNTWVHVACVFNSGTGKIYLNGVEAVSGALNTPQNVTRTLNYIGRSQWADAYANMRMDEFRIWNMARTVTEIQSSMNSSLAGNESGLLAYLRFDESSGTTAINSTAAGTNAAMLNSASRAVSTAPVPGPNFISSKNSFSHNFVTIGISSSDTMWVKNLGAASLQIDSVRSSNSEFVILPSSAIVVSGDSLRFISTLTATSTGAKSSTMSFYSNAFSTPNSYTASGTAISSEPTVRDSHAVVTTLLPYSATLKWTEGDAENHLVLIKASSAVDGIPSDGTTYSANSIFGSGAQIGTGNYIVYGGVADSVVLSGLSAGTTYHVSVVGYNGSGTTTNFLTPSAAITSFTVPYAVNSPNPGHALSFDGTNWRNIEILSSTPTAYTIEFWVKPSTTANQSIFSRTDAGGPNGSYSHALDIYNGKFRHYLYDGSGKSVIDNVDVVTGNWYHVAIVASNSGTMRLYVNGSEVGTPLSVATLWTNGDRYVAGFGGLGSFVGSMDELRIWSVVRTAQQIRENQHRRLSGSQTGLISYYQFNEGDGTTSADSINGFSATLYNNPEWQTSTIPFGSGTSTSVTSVQSGSQSIGSVTLNLTDGFDNNTDVTVTEISTAPNALPSGYSSLVGSKYFIVSAFGSTGSFSTDVSINFGSDLLDPRVDTYPVGIKLYHRNSNSDGSWTLIGGASSANSSTGLVTWSGITSFSQFAAVYEESALPVELVSFTVNTKRLNTELQWKTASEVNNYGFEVERAKKNDELGILNWSKVGFVEGNGTTNAPKDYSFIDKNLSAGKYSYRLKMIDRDGKFSYSQEVEIAVGGVPKVFVLEQNYPNPFNPSTTIGFMLQTSGMTTLKVYDAIGREVATLVNEYLEAGVFHQKTFDASKLSSGIYFAQLKNEGAMQLKKMILLK